jgi:hypothetical protein
MLLEPPPTCVLLGGRRRTMRETTVVARRVETDDLDDLDGVSVADETIRFGIDGAVDDVLAEDGGDDACMVCHI